MDNEIKALLTSLVLVIVLIAIIVIYNSRKTGKNIEKEHGEEQN